MAEKPSKRLASEMAAKRAEEEAARMISGGDMPAEAPSVPAQEQIEPELLPEVVALREQQAKDLAESEAAITAADESIAFNDIIQANIADLAAGKIAGISATGPVPLEQKGAGQGGPATFTATDGTKFTDYTNYLEYQDYLDGKREARQSAFDLLYQQFSEYGLSSLVEPLKNLIKDSTVSPSEFTIRLRQTDPYKKRFAANEARIGKGLRALTEGEYLELEDSYQNIMRRYGLPQSYYTRGDLGRQEGFEKFIEADVSPVELEERISTAQNRVTNAAPEVMQSLKDYYGDVITNGDVLAYVLNPQKAMSEIQRKVTAAEIGAGAAQAGLTAGGLAPKDIAGQRARAEELARFGVTGEEARRGFQAVAEVAPRGGQLAEFYKEAPYTQQTAEAEVFGTTGAVEARKKRERLVGREQASFAGSSGAFQGALSRDRQGAF